MHKTRVNYLASAREGGHETRMQAVLSDRLGGGHRVEKLAREPPSLAEGVEFEEVMRRHPPSESMVQASRQVRRGHSLARRDAIEAALNAEVGVALSRHRSAYPSLKKYEGMTGCAKLIVD